jgi:hypothetical protein
MVRRGYALTPTQLRVKLAQLTQTRITPFTNGVPGISWLKWFKKRHLEFSLRQPQGIEMNKAKVLCLENVARLYKNLSNLYDQKKYERTKLVHELGAGSGEQGKRERGVGIVVRNPKIEKNSPKIEFFQMITLKIQILVKNRTYYRGFRRAYYCQNL